MTDQDNSPRSAALQELEAALDRYRRAQGDAGARPRPKRFLAGYRWGLPRPNWQMPFNLRSPFDRRHPVVRWISISLASLVVLLIIGGGALWWRLSSGPIVLDLATPWLASAIEQNLGGRYRVVVAAIIDKTELGKEQSFDRQLSVMNKDRAEAQQVTREAILGGIRDMLVTELFVQDRFIVLERDTLDAVIAEQEFSASANAGDATRIPPAQLEGGPDSRGLGPTHALFLLQLGEAPPAQAA